MRPTFLRHMAQRFLPFFFGVAELGGSLPPPLDATELTGFVTEVESGEALAPAKDASVPPFLAITSLKHLEHMLLVSERLRGAMST